jgi:hypothetical protein
VAVSTAWTRTVIAVRTFDDAVGISDAWTRALTLLRGFADAVTTSDAWARITAKIAGYTRSSTGAIIPNATVDVFVSTSNLFYASVTSDIYGYYEILVVPGVTYFIVAYDLAGDVYGVTARDLEGVV